MKAIVYTQYGSADVLQRREVAKPIPGNDQVLVNVHAASVNAGDWHLMRGEPFLVRLMFGLLKPRHKILGSDVAGRVEAVGINVTQFQAGDEVFGDLSESGFGGFAEYVCAREAALVSKPASMTFEEAAAVPVAGVTALQGLRDKGHIQSGHKVLIHGASGGVGTFAVQIAKAFGADVTGVCSTSKLDMVRSIGADQVIDYTRDDFTRTGQRYDLILDTAAHRSLSDYRRALRPTGVYVMVGGPLARMFQIMLLGSLISKNGNMRMTNVMMKPSKDDLSSLKELLEAGKVVPVIDRRYTLADVPDAIRYLEAGRAAGKVVITLEPDIKS